MADSKEPSQQISIRGFRHGGVREGAGRPNHTGEPAHLKRPPIESKICADVQFVLKENLPSLRKKHLFNSFKRALTLSSEKGWRILQYSLKNSQVNLLVECDNNSMLESCTKSFGTSLSKRLNLLTERTGSVFKGRYRIELILSPEQLKKVVQKHYLPKNTLTESPRYFLTWTASEDLKNSEGVKNVLKSPTLAWLKQSLASAP